MTFDEFMEKMLATFPEGSVSTDSEGQLVVYTNLHTYMKDGKELVKSLDQETTDGT